MLVAVVSSQPSGGPAASRTNGTVATVTPARIKAVRISGFRSLADVELLDLPNAAVLIGANGSGKSNILCFFEMLGAMAGGGLAEFVARRGGADAQLFRGSKETPRMEAEIELCFGGDYCHGYRFALSRAANDRLYFSEEMIRPYPDKERWLSLGNGHSESMLPTAARGEIPGVGITSPEIVANQFRRFSVYHLHDTSDSSGFTKSWDASDSLRLRPDGGNLAPVLREMKRVAPDLLDRIQRQIARVLPVFEGFDIEEGYGRVTLRWKGKGWDGLFGSHLTSGGSLRFFTLATLLNLPPEGAPKVTPEGPPEVTPEALRDVILLDEPELGLHPAAVSLVGSMIQSLAAEQQIIVATQSPLLVDAFGLDEVFVLDLEDGRTEVGSRLEPAEYKDWLDGFSAGEIWEKNLIGGRP